MRFGSSSRTILLAVALYVVCSLGYFVSGTLAFYQQQVGFRSHVHDPFEMNFDNRTVTEVEPEAKEAGLRAGDTVESLEGKPYRGELQWRAIEYERRPGEELSVSVREPKGSHRTITIPLRAGKPMQLPASAWFVIVGVQFVCNLGCLVIGYWVVLARPRERNAWLILLFLSFPEVLFMSPGGWAGWLFVFQEIWYQTLQILGPLVVLLIGIYFPERWRVDRKLPWLKWILLAPPLVSLILILISEYGELIFSPALGALSIQLGPAIEAVVNPTQLACVVVYWVAIFDKLRSASTADARRRMQVLCAGSVLGLGSLLIVFVLFRHIGLDPSKRPWLAGTGAALTMLFPFSLAYVVIVQRALDVRILLRMGTKYILARATLMVLQYLVAGFAVWQGLLPLLSKKSLRPADLVIPLVLGVVVVASAYFGSAKRFQRWLDRKFFREAYTAELVLSELSEKARTLTESSSLLSTISHRISEVLHVPQIGVLLRGSAVFRLQQAVGLDMTSPVLLPESSETVRHLLQENRPATLYREDPESWYFQAGDEEKRTLNSVNAEILLPLPGREKLMGFMTLGPKLSEEPYSPSDLRLLQSVATQTGLALEVNELAGSLAREAAQRERINREIEIAREVQERLFPQTTPRVPGIDLAGACRPAQAVGGDYYDFIELDDGRLGLAVGDVSGKGVSAALLMASLRASLRGMAMGEGARDLARLMSNVNRLVYEASTANRFATFFFSVFDPMTRELRYVNAGHNPPVVLRAAGNPDLTVERLKGGGPAVGLLRNLRYEERSLTLAPGDLLIAYTDGISEAMTNLDEEWGEERMIAAAESSSGADARTIIQDIFKAADDFTRGAEQHDDMTLLIMKIE